MTEQITERFHTIERSTHGGHDQTLMEQYIEQPGEDTHDPFYWQDKLLARLCWTWLNTRLPRGYEWCVRSDLRQGVVMVSIPLLMGVNRWGVINLRTTEIHEGLPELAGQILERYRLSRERFSLAALLEAREKYSALTHPWREVPV